MNVSDMRKRLFERKLDVDGTKEMLLKRLEASNAESDDDIYEIIEV